MYKLLILSAYSLIYKVFYASLLYKAATNPLLRQVIDLPPSINITRDDKEYKLIVIQAVKLYYKKLFYYGNWLGWDKDPEFYPTINFKYTLHLL